MVKSTALPWNLGSTPSIHSGNHLYRHTGIKQTNKKIKINNLLRIPVPSEGLAPNHPIIFVPGLIPGSLLTPTSAKFMRGLFQDHD